METLAETESRLQSPAPPAAPRRPWPLRLYTQELPRAIRELRWALAVVVGLWAAGALAAYVDYDGVLEALTAVGTGQEATPPQRLLLALARATQWRPWWPAFVDRPEWYGTWYGYLVHNTCIGLYHAICGVISLGLWAMGCAWDSGWRLTWGLASAAAHAHAATGLGVFGTMLVQIAPHGALEEPALWLVNAAALRAGLAWVRPRRGVRRWASMVRGLRHLGVVFIAIVPVLLAAGVLEATVAPSVREHCLLGIGAAPGMASEQRALPSRTGGYDCVVEAVPAPDGRQFAVVDSYVHSLHVGRPGLAGWPELATLSWDALGSPSFSHDARRLAYVFNNWGQNGRLYVADLQAHNQVPLAGGPPGRYLAAAWSPRADVVAVAVAPYGKDWPDVGTGNLWLADLIAKRWLQLTHFTHGNGLALASVPAWSPDGMHLAVSRLGDARSSGLWTMRKDGSDLRRLTGGPRVVNPAWSPRGDRIAFVTTSWDGDALPPGLYERMRATYGTNNLSLIRPDGTGRQDHLANVDPFSPPSWSADGRRLIYIRSDTVIEGMPKAP